MRKIADGLLHDYVTCPKCGDIVSIENVVRLDGVKMCRGCLKVQQEKRRMEVWRGRDAS